MSELDDLADLIEVPARGKPVRGSLRTSRRNWRSQRGGSDSISGRVALSNRRKPPITLAKVNLPE